MLPNKVGSGIPKTKLVFVEQASQLSPLPTPQSFFWRQGMRVTARLDVSTVALTSQPSPLPTRQEKKIRQKKSRSDFFWRRPLRVTARLDESTVNIFVIFFVNFFRIFFRKSCHLMTYNFLLIRRVHIFSS